MKTLRKIYEEHKKGDWPDKGSVHSYIEVYEEILAPYRGRAKNILEVGLMSGESLRMWSEYFMGVVHGIDCDIKPINGMADLTQAIADGLRVSIGDATSAADIEKFYKGIKFDVVIEDAGHSLQQQLDIYNTLKPYLYPWSIYIIEDVQDIDKDRDVFLNIDRDRRIEILDRRVVKGRYDDVLVIIRPINEII